MSAIRASAAPCVRLLPSALRRCEVGAKHRVKAERPLNGIPSHKVVRAEAVSKKKKKKNKKKKKTKTKNKKTKQKHYQHKTNARALAEN